MAIQIPFSSKTYTERRNELIGNMSSGQILLIANGESSINFADNWHPYRQDSTFLYYGGIAAPDMAIVMDIDNGTTTLFGDDLSIDMIIWTGPQPSISDLGAQVGIDDIKPMSALKSALRDQIHYLPPYRAEHTIQLQGLTGHTELKSSVELIKAIIAQRLMKSDEEIAELQKAVQLSKLMHAEVQKHIKPGVTEYELVGVASKFAHDRNARWSFPPILTKNGHTLHNHYHGHTLSEGDMLLMDGGIEVSSGYCGDITRTTAVSGSFSTEQQEIYDLVHKMYQEGIATASAGKRYLDVHLHTCSVLVDGLKDLGLMKGDTKDAVAAGAHALFFQHGLGHMMGLDVHDMENFGEQYVGYSDDLQKSTQFGLKSLRLGNTLQERNVITIEPGIYFIPELIDKFRAEGKFTDFINYDAVDKKRNLGGIRIEDDFVVRAESVEILGGTVPMP